MPDTPTPSAGARKTGKLSGKTAADFIEDARQELAMRTKMTVEDKQKILDATIAAAEGQDSYESAGRAACAAVLRLADEKRGRA